MTHLFISHSTRDGGAIAQQLAASLEAAGHRCWIAPRDVKPGVPYPGQIVTAIESCAGLVLLVTPAANESPDVLQEIQLASAARAVIAPVIVNATVPGPDMRYYIGVRHQIPWSDAPATTADLLRSFPAERKLAQSNQSSRFGVRLLEFGPNVDAVVELVALAMSISPAQARQLAQAVPVVLQMVGEPEARRLTVELTNCRATAYVIHRN